MGYQLSLHHLSKKNQEYEPSSVWLVKKRKRQQRFFPLTPPEFSNTCCSVVNSNSTVFYRATVSPRSFVTLFPQWAEDSFSQRAVALWRVLYMDLFVVLVLSVRRPAEARVLAICKLSSTLSMIARYKLLHSLQLHHPQLLLLWSIRRIQKYLSSTSLFFPFSFFCQWQIFSSLGHPSLHRQRLPMPRLLREIALWVRYHQTHKRSVVQTMAVCFCPSWFRWQFLLDLK